MECSKYILGNWKMYKTRIEAEEYMKQFKSAMTNISVDAKVGIVAPFTALSTCVQACQGSNILTGSQNLYHEKQGAYTGEISSLMLKEIGVHFVLIGHSERRTLFNETDDMVSAKVKSALDEHLLPVVCIGESLEIKEKGDTKEFLENQLKKSLALTSSSDNIVIAYEPVWAIGTGKAATVAEVHETHKFCRKMLSDLYSKEKSENISILYGGSVKLNNSKEFASSKEINGLLVGGASLKVDEFTGIVQQFCL